MTLKNLMNSSSSYLMSTLCKSSTNKFMIMVKKKRYRQDYENNILGTKIIFYLKKKLFIKFRD